MKPTTITIALGVLVSPGANAGVIPISDYSLFGGNLTTLGSDVVVNSGIVGSNGNVTLGSRSAVHSVVGAGELTGGSRVKYAGDAIFNGNVAVGNNSQASGNISSGGSFLIGSGATVGGDIKSSGTGAIGTNASVSGAVDVGAPAGVAMALGSGAQVAGTVTHRAGTTVSIPGSASVGGDVLGSPAAPTQYLPSLLADPAAITAGVTDVTKGSGQTTNLLPGSYRNVVLGAANTLNLGAGSYFFDSWIFGNGGSINFDLASGNIALFFAGDVTFGSGLLTTLINGDAGGVYAETKGDWVLGNNGQWNGTIFGSDAGSDITFGSGTTLSGALIATHNLVIGNASTVTLFQDPQQISTVPEPSSMLLLATALLGLASRRRGLSSRSE